MSNPSAWRGPPHVRRGEVLAPAWWWASPLAITAAGCVASLALVWAW